MKPLILVGIILVTALVLYHMRWRVFPAQVILTGESIPGECENKIYVADRAEYIVEGIVEKIIAIFPRGRKSPTYYYIIEIESGIKGDIKEGKIQLVGGLHKFLEEGEKVKIYFEERNGKFFTTCGGFGIEKIPKG
jgi:hypothetical protein